MKWIGQHIWSFISRFRSDVYLEDLTTDSSTDILVVDSNNKVCKNSAAGDDMAFTLTGDSGSNQTIDDGSTLDVAGGTNITTVVGATDTVTANLDNPLAGPIEIENAAADTALLIDNNTVDQIALDIDAANTTANVIDIASTALTTAKAVNIDCNSLTSGSAIYLDVDDALETSTTKALVTVDYAKSGDMGNSTANRTTGLYVNMADTATNNNAGSITSMTGAGILIDSANANGTVSQTGLKLQLTDGDVATTTGIQSTVEDGGTDIKMISTANGGDYCTIATTTNGATKITTVDADAAAANFEVEADGDITLDAAGTIKLEGPVRPTGQLQTTYHMIKDDIGSGSPIYIGLQEADAETGSISNKNLPFIAPVAGKLLKIFLRTTEDMSASGHDTNLTWSLLTRTTSGTTGGNAAVVGAQTGAGPTASSMATYDFTTGLDGGVGSETNAIAAGDKVQISVQSDAASADSLFFITCLWEWDFSSIG